MSAVATSRGVFAPGQWFEVGDSERAHLESQGLVLVAETMSLGEALPVVPLGEAPTLPPSATLGARLDTLTKRAEVHALAAELGVALEDQSVSKMKAALLAAVG